MPSDSSFDIVSELNVQEMDNAMNQAVKEISTRYDFKGTNTTFELSNDAGADGDVAIDGLVMVVNGAFTGPHPTPLKEIDLI